MSTNGSCLLAFTVLCLWPVAVHLLITWFTTGAKRIDWSQIRLPWRKQ
jgi:hypothetical protein